MNRVSQGLLLVLFGGAVLYISAFSTLYVNYVKPWFQPFLIASGAVVTVVGLLGLVQAVRRSSRTASGEDRDREGGAEHAVRRGPEGHGHGEPAHGGHEHSHLPRVAWLMALPVFAIFLISPPALGSFAATRSEEPQAPPPVAEEGYAPLRGDGPIAMPVGEFVGRAWGDPDRSLAGKQVRLTGFVTPSKKKGRWYVTRMQMNCCAADAIALKVAVLGVRAPQADTWVEVTGTWVPPRSAELPVGTVAPELAATRVVQVPRPVEPYE